MSMPEPIFEPELDIPLQKQKVFPLKTGTSKILDSGLRIAKVSVENGLSGHRIKQCLLASSVATAVTQSRQVQRTFSKGFAIHEYCCHQDSLLGTLAQRQGHTIRRWGLFNVDLFTVKGVQTVADSIRKDLKSGLTVVLWIAVPCTPWCAYQRMNEARLPGFQRS